MKKLSFYGLSLILIIAVMASCKDKPASERKDVKTDPEIIKKEAESSKKLDKKVILCYGNSLTAGYGLDPEDSYPTLLQERIDSLGFDYTVVNAGLSGETTSGGKERISWVLRNPIDVFILELGANDMLRGLDISETRKNLEAIIDVVLEKYPETKIILAGMQSPPNMGEAYVVEFASIFKDLAKKYDAGLIPFFLEGVAGKPELILPDGKHPNIEGQKVVVENVWKEVEKVVLLND